MKKMKAELISSCGFNCALCVYNQRNEKEKGYCAGCDAKGGIKKVRCTNCALKTCHPQQIANIRFCYECDEFPCQKLKRLDKKYIKRANTSMIANLKYIQQNGMEAFLESETNRWKCKNCGEIISIHNQLCMKCNTPVSLHQEKACDT